MFVPDLLRGKRILITGGGTGLGKSMAGRILELGAEVVICGRRADVLEEAAAELKQAKGGTVRWRPLDIRDPDAVESVLGEIWTETPIHGLINNAAGNFLARTETLSHRAVDAVVSIVLHGSAYMTLACGKRWIADCYPGNVLSIVTTYAWTGSPYVVPSAMAKAGVTAMTRSLAVEWAKYGIRFNAIAPGPFPTKGAWSRILPGDISEKLNVEQQVPLRRAGDHQELANLAAYMISDYAGYMNGEVVTLDSGEWIKNAGQFNKLEKVPKKAWGLIERAVRGKKK